MSRRLSTFEEQVKYAEEHRCTIAQAKVRLALERSSSEKAVFVRKFVAMTGKSQATAVRAFYRLKHDKSYHMTTNDGRVCYRDVCDLRLEHDAITNTYRVFYRDEEVRIHTCRRANGKKWLFILLPQARDVKISLAALIYVLHTKKDIDAGYVVDHINNDSLDNRLENLQLITRAENVRKNAVGHNQHNVKR